MLWFIDNVGEMVVRAREHGVELVFDAFCGVAIDILDTCQYEQCNLLRFAYTLIALISPYDNEFGPIRTTGCFL